MNQLVIDYLRQLVDLAEDAIAAVQGREQEEFTDKDGCDCVEDLMVVHNRLTRVSERTTNEGKPRRK